MTITRKELIKIRMDLAKQMHRYILEEGDENIFNIWFMCGVPDCPSEEDFEFFAENDEEWANLCSLFGRLASRKKM